MSEPATDSDSASDYASDYDRVLYGSRPVSVTAPDHLALTSLLLGGPRPRRDGFRMLEIGCAEGGNLIPLAVHHPDCHFVGLDYSAAQIGAARAEVAAVGAGNVSLIHGDVRDAAVVDGSFDYIVAHGVYSWIPAEARRALLELCRRHLAPDGIAYVSYNTFPGWKLRSTMRELALRAAAGADDPDDLEQRWQQARAAARTLLEAIPTNDGDFWTSLMVGELEKVACASLSYMTHEYLSPENEAFYLADFARDARSAGLGYVGDAMNLRSEDSVTRRVYESLSESGLQGLELEQSADLIRRRCFRASLLCVGERALTPPQPDAPELWSELWIAASLTAPEGPPRLLPDELERFRGLDGVELGIRDPLAKAAFRVLEGVYPSALGLRELGARAVRLMEESGFTVEPPEPPLDSLAGDLLMLYQRGQAELRLRDWPLRLDAGDRPRASTLTQREAAQGDTVTTPLHDRLDLGAVERAVVLLLDGTRDAGAILDEVVRQVLDGEVDLIVDRARVTDAEQVPGVVASRMRYVVERLAAWGLLIPPAK